MMKSSPSEPPLNPIPSDFRPRISAPGFLPQVPLLQDTECLVEPNLC